MIPGQTDADPQDAPQPNQPAVSGLLDQPRRPAEAAAAASAGAGSPPLRLGWALLVSLVAGLLLAAASPPLGLWPLAFVSPALLVLALSGRSLRTSFTVGLVFGLAFFFPLVAWVINLAWFAWVALAIASALIFAVFAIAQRLLLTLRWWPPAVAGWWVAAEAFRDRWPWGGFPWGRLAMSQAGVPTQGWAAIAGPPALTFVVALVGATLGWVLLTALASRRAALRSRLLLLPAVALAGSVAVALLPAALTLDPVAAGTKTAVVAAIQGDVPRARSLAAELNNVELEITLNHVTATDKLAAAVAAGHAAKPDLVVWPENSTDIDPMLYPPVYQEITSAAAAIGRPILVGAVLQNPERNAGVLWLPNKGPTTIYAKRRLVPFGEYVPFRSLISKITSLTSLQPTDFTPGHQTVVFNVGQIKLGDIICYEVGFDDLVRSEVAAGANLLSMQSNDATFEREGPTTAESGQQLAMARIRAVEFDRAVVVASTTGYSAIVAPDGHLISRSGMWTQAELEARVPLLSYSTLAERLGAWPEWAIVGATSLALGLAIGQASAARRRRTRSGNATDQTATAE
ncbi:MAG TPA: apolipoprotein N-acyltransferase [Trebonia sp.]|jgi:apolipoprotein N-acyltransferase|nr:apolipoprotein N-acyltransferase [Trebonia sp.]